MNSEPLFLYSVMLGVRQLRHLRTLFVLPVKNASCLLLILLQLRLARHLFVLGHVFVPLLCHAGELMHSLAQSSSSPSVGGQTSSPLPDEMLLKTLFMLLLSSFNSSYSEMPAVVARLGVLDGLRGHSLATMAAPRRRWGDDTDLVSDFPCVRELHLSRNA